jgi:hypothetical protein
MSDARLRELERRSRESGDPHDEVRYLRALLQAGGRDPSPLTQELAAWEAFFLLSGEGLPLLECLELTRELAPQGLAADLATVEARVRRGGLLSEELAGLDRVPLSAAALFSEGELRGGLHPLREAVLLALRVHAARDLDPGVRDMHTLACLMRAGVGFGQGAERLRSAVVARAAPHVLAALAALPGDGPEAIRGFEAAPRLLRELLVRARGFARSYALCDRVTAGVLDGLLEVPLAALRPVPLRWDLQRLFLLLGVGFGVGLPAVHLFELLSPWLSRAELREVLAEVLVEVREGHSIHEVLDAHPAFFPVAARTLFRRAERGGDLGRACDRVAAALGQGVFVAEEPWA